MSRLTRDGTAEPVSRDQILRHVRGQGNTHFPCSADHEQDWQPYPVDPYSAICDDHTYILYTYIYILPGGRGGGVSRLLVDNIGVIEQKLSITMGFKVGFPSQQSQRANRNSNSSSRHFCDAGTPRPFIKIVSIIVLVWCIS